MDSTYGRGCGRGKAATFLDRFGVELGIAHTLREMGPDEIISTIEDPWGSSSIDLDVIGATLRIVAEVPVAPLMRARSRGAHSPRR